MDAPPDRLVCKICQLPCCEAQQSECCGSIYCKCDIDQLKATTTTQPACPMCRSEDFITYPNLAIDREVQQLMVYCPAKKTTGCDWIGKLDDVDKHYSDGKECETKCEKCKTTVKHKLLRSHLDTECPCYCPYCDMTAKREVISNEHKENCHKFPLTCSNNNNGVDNVPRDKFDKTNNIIESQNGENINPSVLVELHQDVSIVREAAQSLQIAKECSDKVDGQNDSTFSRLLSQVFNIMSYLSIAVMIIAILVELLSQQQMQANLSQHIATELNNSVLVSKQMGGIRINHKINEISLRQQLNLLQVKLEEDIYEHKQNTELQQHTALFQEVPNRTVTNHYDQMNSSVWSVQVAPVIVKMSSFSKKLRDKEQWLSDPFFAFEGGYQMCLIIYAAGNGKGEGTHVSVYLHLMKGPHDDELEQSGHWPLRGTFTIELLNQLNDSDHYSRMVQLHHHFCSLCTNRVIQNLMSNAGRGEPQFISHEVLHNSDNGYHISDSLIFRIFYEDTNAQNQVAPATFKVTHFSQWLENKEPWYSSPFFAFDGGYQLDFLVHGAGLLDGEGTHVCVGINLIPGPHDDKLEQSGHWPLRGTFKIELLNQLNDSDHYSSPTVVNAPSGSIGRAENNKVNVIQSTSKFISYDILFQHNGYLKNDILYFRILYYAKDVVKENIDNV